MPLLYALQKWENRVRCLRDLKDIGFMVRGGWLGRVGCKAHDPGECTQNGVFGGLGFPLSPNDVCAP